MVQEELELAHRLTAPPRVPLAAELLRFVVASAGGEVPATRTSFAQAHGSSPTAVSNAATHLIARGLLRDGRYVPRTGSGRPTRVLEVNPDLVVLGVSIGDAPVEVVHGARWRESRASTAHCIPVRLDGSYDQSALAYLGDTGKLARQMARSIAKVAKKVKREGKDVVAIGVMLGGHIDNDVIRYSPNMGGVPQADLGDCIGRELADWGGGGVLVSVENDANAIARRYLLAGDLPADSAYVLVKNDGIGSGMVVGGRVFTGANGMAGEIGHIPLEPTDPALACRCGRTGCLERLATPLAIAQRLELKGTPTQVYAELGEMLHSTRRNPRNAAAHRAAADAGAYLGRALAMLVNFMDPGPVRIGLPDALIGVGSYTEAVEEAARTAVYTSACLEVSFVQAPDHDETAATGAARAIEKIIDML